jgi:hypothetical protein
MDTYFGGIFLIDPRATDSRKYIYSPYDNNVYPHLNFLFFDKKNKYRSLYKADKDIVFKWLEEKYTNGEFGFQGIFNDLNAAQNFKNLFISKPENIVTISIHLPVTEFDELANWTEQELEVQNPKRGNNIYENLKKKISNNLNGQALGFDLLETYYGVVYNMLYETDENLEKIMNVATFNEYGLISTYEDACKAKQFSEDRNIWLIKRH